MKTRAVKEQDFVLEQNGISAGVSEGSLGITPQNEGGGGWVGGGVRFIPC